MTDTNVFQLSHPGSFADSLTEVLRNGACAHGLASSSLPNPPERPRLPMRRSRIVMILASVLPCLVCSAGATDGATTMAAACRMSARSTAPSASRLGRGRGQWRACGLRPRCGPSGKACHARSRTCRAIFSR